jgi:hypothetical protein
MSTRPDIAFAVSILSQFMRNLGQVHWEATKEAMHYLKGTANIKLTSGAEEQGLEAYMDCFATPSTFNVWIHCVPPWSSGHMVISETNTYHAIYS